MAITREQIFTACDQIFAQGKKPTIEAIRTLLGTGSYSTIGKYLKEWREQSPDASDVIPSDIVTPDLHAAAYDALKPFLGVLVDRVSENLESQRLKTLEQENERYEQQIQELAGLREANRDLLLRIEELSQALALAKAGIGIEDAGKLDRLEQENQNLRSQLVEAEYELCDLRDKAALLEVQHSAAVKRCGELEQENQPLKIAAANAQTLESQLEEARKANDSLSSQLGSKNSKMYSLAGEVVYIDPYIYTLIEQELHQRQAKLTPVSEEKTKKPAAKSRSRSKKLQADQLDIDSFLADAKEVVSNG